MRFNFEYVKRESLTEVASKDRRIIDQDLFLGCKFAIDTEKRIRGAQLDPENGVATSLNATKQLLELEFIEEVFSPTMWFRGKYTSQEVSLFVQSGKIKSLMLLGHFAISDSAFCDCTHSALKTLIIDCASITSATLRSISSIKSLEKVSILECPYFKADAAHLASFQGLRDFSTNINSFAIETICDLSPRIALTLRQGEIQKHLPETNLG